MPDDESEAEQTAEVARFAVGVRRTVRDVLHARLTKFEREAVVDRSRALVYRTRILIRHLRASTSNDHDRCDPREQKNSRQELDWVRPTPRQRQQTIASSPDTNDAAFCSRAIRRALKMGWHGPAARRVVAVTVPRTSSSAINEPIACGSAAFRPVLVSLHYVAEPAAAAPAVRHDRDGSSIGSSSIVRRPAGGV